MPLCYIYKLVFDPNLGKRARLKSVPAGLLMWSRIIQYQRRNYGIDSWTKASMLLNICVQPMWATQFVHLLRNTRLVIDRRMKPLVSPNVKFSIKFWKHADIDVDRPSAFDPDVE
jgi:hypothetical protein